MSITRRSKRYSKLARIVGELHWVAMNPTPWEADAAHHKKRLDALARRVRAELRNLIELTERQP